MAIGDSRLRLRNADARPFQPGLLNAPDGGQSLPLALDKDDCLQCPGSASKILPNLTKRVAAELQFVQGFPRFQMGANAYIVYEHQSRSEYDVHCLQIDPLEGMLRLVPAQKLGDLQGGRDAAATSLLVHVIPGIGRCGGHGVMSNGAGHEGSEKSDYG